ncbi:MAG: DUF1800 family protein, partial [Steroidobacteraceae bacterium]
MTRFMQPGGLRGRYRARCLIAALSVVAAGLAGCAATAPSGGSVGAPLAAPLPVLHRDDVAWLERATFGLDSGTLSEYLRLGRARYIERQLHPRTDGHDDADLPAPVAAQIEALDVSHLDVTRTLADLRARRLAIRLMTNGADKSAARKALNQQGNRLADAAIRRELLRAIYSPDQ